MYPKTMASKWVLNIITLGELFKILRLTRLTVTNKPRDMELLYLLLVVREQSAVRKELTVLATKECPQVV